MIAFLAVSHQEENVYAERAVRAGAHGYVIKTIAAKTMIGEEDANEA
jgi:DNA-binding NarL/FixJ family response regulator